MSEQKPRTWWITKEFWPKANEQHYAFKFKPDVKQYGETFEVVQKSEYDDLRKAHDENIMVLRAFQEMFKRIAPEFEKLKAENEMLRKNK